MFGIIKKNRKNRPANKFAPNIESLENRPTHDGHHGRWHPDNRFDEW